jgi:hypothetical protein
MKRRSSADFSLVGGVRKKQFNANGGAPAEPVVLEERVEVLPGLADQQAADSKKQ